MWRLKDRDTPRLFTREMSSRNYDVAKADDIQKKWLPMKETAQMFQTGVWNDERSTSTQGYTQHRTSNDQGTYYQH